MTDELTKITLSVYISKPYVRQDGKMVIKFIVCGEEFECEIESYKGEDGQYILKNVDDDKGH